MFYIFFVDHSILVAKMPVEEKSELKKLTKKKLFGVLKNYGFLPTSESYFTKPFLIDLINCVSKKEPEWEDRPNKRESLRIADDFKRKAEIERDERKRQNAFEREERKRQREIERRAKKIQDGTLKGQLRRQPKGKIRIGKLQEDLPPLDEIIEEIQREQGFAEPEEMENEVYEPDIPKLSKSEREAWQTLFKSAIKNGVPVKEAVEEVLPQIESKEILPQVELKEASADIDSDNDGDLYSDSERYDKFNLYDIPPAESGSGVRRSKKKKMQFSKLRKVLALILSRAMAK